MHGWGFQPMMGEFDPQRALSGYLLGIPSERKLVMKLH